MTNHERWDLFESGEFRQIIGIKLLDWAGYWTTAGLDGIQDNLQKAQMKSAINMVVQDLGYVMKVVASLAVSDPAIVQSEEVSEEMIGSVVTAIMSNKLLWVTGVDKVYE